MYSPKDYATWQKEVGAALAKVDASFFDGPVKVTVDCFGTRPKSSKLLFPRSDVDNYAKGILDVITKDGRFWNDDSQVGDLSVRKRWGEPGEAGYVTVSIEDVEL